MPSSSQPSSGTFTRRARPTAKEDAAADGELSSVLASSGWSPVDEACCGGSGGAKTRVCESPVAPVTAAVSARTAETNAKAPGAEDDDGSALRSRWACSQRGMSTWVCRAATDSSTRSSADPTRAPQTHQIDEMNNEECPAQDETQKRVKGPGEEAKKKKTTE